MLVSSPQLFSGNFLEILESDFSWQAQYLVMFEGITSVAPRNANNVSYVMRINHESHFSWQGQYLVMFEARVIPLLARAM